MREQRVRERSESDLVAIILAIGPTELAYLHALPCHSPRCRLGSERRAGLSEQRVRGKAASDLVAKDVCFIIFPLFI